MSNSLTAYVHMFTLIISHKYKHDQLHDTVAVSALLCGSWASIH